MWLDWFYSQTEIEYTPFHTSQKGSVKNDTMLLSSVHGRLCQHHTDFLLLHPAAVCPLGRAASLRLCTRPLQQEVRLWHCAFHVKNKQRPCSQWQSNSWNVPQNSFVCLITLPVSFLSFYSYRKLKIIFKMCTGAITNDAFTKLDVFVHWNLTLKRLEWICLLLKT